MPRLSDIFIFSPARFASLAALLISLLFRCIGPDLGSTQNKNKKINPGETAADCAYCLQLPQIVSPANLAVIDNTTGKINIAPIVSEACEYAFSGGVNFTTVIKKSTGTITEFVPVTAWPLGQAIHVSVRCFNSENTASAQITGTSTSQFSVVLAKPAVVNPFAGYITTSNLLRVKSTQHTPAVVYEWEIRQSGVTLMTASVASPETVVEIPFPAGVYGSFEARTRYRDTNNVYSEYSDWISFVIKDRTAATTVYSQNFTTMPVCASNMTTLIVAGCQGINIFGTYPTCDAIGWEGGGGNAWMCNSGFEGTVVLQTNNASYNHLTFYSAVYQWVNVTQASYEVETHQHGNAEDPAATNVVCRAYPAEGNDGFAFIVYPYRTTGVNVEIREKRFSTNTYNVLSSAYRTEAQLLTGPSRTWLRFDCLGTSFTGYYKNTAGKWYPLIVAESTFAAKLPHRIGMGTGQGPQWIKLRIYNINLKEVL